MEAWLTHRLSAGVIYLLGSVVHQDKVSVYDSRLMLQLSKLNTLSQLTGLKITLTAKKFVTKPKRLLQLFFAEVLIDSVHSRILIGQRHKGLG